MLSCEKWHAFKTQGFQITWKKGEKKKRKKINRIWAYFPQTFLWAAGKRESQVSGQSYQETSSGFSFVMIKTWQRIFKTPDKIIDFFEHAVKDEREQTYKLLRNCSHLLSAFINIIFTHLVGRTDVEEESEPSALLPQKRNGHKGTSQFTPKSSTSKSLRKRSQGVLTIPSRASDTMLHTVFLNLSHPRRQEEEGRSTAALLPRNLWFKGKTGGKQWMCSLSKTTQECLPEKLGLL